MRGGGSRRVLSRAASHSWRDSREAKFCRMRRPAQDGPLPLTLRYSEESSE